MPDLFTVALVGTALILFLIGALLLMLALGKAASHEMPAPPLTRPTSSNRKSGRA